MIVTTSPLIRGDHLLTVRNIRDRARKPNTLAETRKNFRYEALYARWKLDEGKKGLAADASGNKPAGFLANGTTWTNATGRSALCFDGGGAYLNTSTALEDLALPFSITLWVNPAAKQRTCANLFGHVGDEGGGTFGLLMQQEYDRTNCYAMTYGDGKKGGGGTPPVQLTADQWQHLAVVCDGSNSVIYVDGVEKGRAPAQGAYAPNRNMTLRLGYVLQNRFFKGLLSDFRIYRTALSPAEVQAVMKE